MTDYTGTGRTEPGLLYDCGHIHKSIQDALLCKKENLIYTNNSQTSEIISGILNTRLRQFRTALKGQYIERDNLEFSLKQSKEAIIEIQNSIDAVTQTLTQLNLSIKE